MEIPKNLVPVLCKNCGKKIGEVKMKDGIVAIKCKCGTVNIVESKQTPSTFKSTSSNQN
jgi:phage FluMu protein Com